MIHQITSFLAAVIASLGIGTSHYVSPTESLKFEDAPRSHTTYMVNNAGILTEIIYKDGTVLELQGENDDDELDALGMETNVILQVSQHPVTGEPDVQSSEAVYATISATGDNVYGNVKQNFNGAVKTAYHAQMCMLCSHQQ